MIRRLPALLLATALVAVMQPHGEAAGGCTVSCRAQVAACRRSECARLRGGERRACAEKCRGRLGCGARIRTLAWVVTRCRWRDGRLTGGQELRIRRGDCDPVTALRLDTPGEVDDFVGLCPLVAENREGFGSVLAGVFQRLGVTADGSGVVFEITNGSQLIEGTPLTDDQQGFFHVRADGSGLRRLGPPSRERTYRIGVTPSGDLTANFETYIPFSPSGDRIAFVDMGPAPDGTEAAQVFTLDLVTRERTQVTRLPATTTTELDRVVDHAFFLDERTIQFHSRALEPAGALYTVRTDGSRLRRSPPLPAISSSMSPSPVAPAFQVARPTGRILSLPLDEAPENPDPFLVRREVAEVFRADGGHLLQLTTFHRYDTYGLGAAIGLGVGRPLAPGNRVFLIASTNRLGENPFENCQLFSVDALGGGLRQLTHFDEGERSMQGCSFGVPPGCSFADVSQDPVTGWIVFYSNCNPFGTNPRGSQVFAMAPDGSRLRQLTHHPGTRLLDDDEADVEIPGPIAYSVPIR